MPEVEYEPFSAEAIRFGWLERSETRVWQGRLYEVCLGADCIVVVRYHQCKGWQAEWRAHFTLSREEHDAVLGEETMPSKWIAAAVSAAEQQVKVGSPTDPVMYKDRPALYDYMTELLDGDGKGREPSVLMVTVSAVGMRVGLKDAASGGWLWREAATLVKCLDAIETVLQAGNVQWSVPGGKFGKTKK